MAETINNRRDIRQHVFGNMQMFDAPEPTENPAWVQLAGTRIGFHVHGVYYNETSKKYAFDVNETWDELTFPNMGQYDSYEELEDGVVETYAGMWHIDQ